MPQDTRVKNLIINRLTKEQYDSIQDPSPTELYFVTGDSGITSADVIAALGYTPESQVNKVTVLSASSTNIQYPSAKVVYDSLALKQDSLVSGTNIKTINSNSLLGSGNITIDAASVGALPDTTTINDLTSSAQQAAINSGATTTNIGQIATNTSAISTHTSDIATINGKIPSQASSSNQLADKAFVNNSVQTATANFRGSWATWAAVPSSAGSYPVDYAGSTTPTVNDYLVVQDASGYTGETLEGTWRFKYSGTWATDGKSGWLPEYQVNETPLTAEQLAALNSGITSNGVSLIGTALQPNDNISELNNDTGYITGITSSDVTTALGFTPYSASNPEGYTSNVGTVTSVNNVSPVNGNVTISIPAAQVNSDWNAASGVAQILNKPTIPVVVDTYSATGTDAISGKGVKAALDTLSIPSKISDLNDDTSTYPIDKADTLTGLTATVAELNYVDGVTSAIQTQLDGKQATLVSGTSIKTVNGNSLLGSGNISIDSLPSQTGNSGKFLTTNGTTASWADTTKVTFRDWSVT